MATKIKYPAADMALLKKLIDWAEARDGGNKRRFRGWGDWDQASWAVETRNGVCKTAFCIAGQAVVQRNYVLLMDYDGTEGGVEVLSAHYCRPGQVVTNDAGKEVLVAKKGSRKIPIEEQAVSELGLLTEEGNILFAGSNTVDGLKEYANAIADHRNLRRPYPDLSASHYRCWFHTLDYDREATR